MEFMAPLAPIAFVFAVAALSQVTTLKKDYERLSKEVKNLSSRGHSG